MGNLNRQLNRLAYRVDYLYPVHLFKQNDTSTFFTCFIDGGINLPEVRNMLGQTDTQMSDSAKALFNAMEAYQKVSVRTFIFFVYKLCNYVSTACMDHFDVSRHASRHWSCKYKMESFTKVSMCSE